MALANLREFLQAIEAAGELVRVSHPVRARLEVAEIADRCMKSPGGGPALLFEHVLLEDGRRSPHPVAINLFGSMRRMCLALGVEDLETIGGRISELLEMKVPEGLFGKLAMLPKLAEVGKFPPRVRGGRAPCQEVVLRGDAVNLDDIPFLTTWPGDGGRYITLPMVITRDPARGIRNVGMYRIQVLGRNTLAMHWQRHKVGAAHWREMAAAGERMPVVIALGGDPASIYSGSAPLPPTIDEFLFAGFLRRQPVDLTKAVTCDLEVPSEAELVLEGYIDPAEPLALEGPFGDHTGFYSLADYYPKVHVTAVTARRDPIYPATLVGRPPMEDYYLGHATERIFLPLLRLTVPEIVDYHMPAPGIFHNLVFVSIDKQYPGQAYKVMNALWGQGLMSLAKVMVVVDKDVNVRDPDEAWWIALNNIDPERDVRFTMGPVDVLDHSSRGFTYGSKMGIDGTRKWKEEGFDREWPERIVMDEETKRRVDEMWSKLGITLADGEAAERRFMSRAFRPSACPPVRRRSDLRRRVALRPLRQLRQAAPHPVRAAVRAARRARGLDDRPGDAETRAPRRDRLFRGAVGGDGLQPDRGSRLRRPEPAHHGAGAAPRRDHARPGVGLGAGGLRHLHARRRCAEPALSSAEPGRARVDPDLQPEQAIHLVAAPLAGPQPGDRAGRRIPRGDGTVERAGLAAPRGGARGRDLGGRVRHLLRPPRRGLRSSGGPEERRGAAG